MRFRKNLSVKINALPTDRQTPDLSKVWHYGVFSGEEGSAVFAKLLEMTTCEIHDLYSSKQVRANSRN